MFFICIQTSKSPCAIGPSILKTSCKSHPHPNTISVEVGLTSGFFWQNHLVFFFPLKSYFPSENHSKFYNFFPCGPNINGTKKCVSKLIKVFSTVSKAYQKTSRFGMVKAWSQTKTRGVSHTMALPFTLKSILRQKKNYGNSNISPCQNIILKKNPLKESKILQDIITLWLISSFNTRQNIIFPNPCIKIELLPRGQNPLSFYTL